MKNRFCTVLAISMLIPLFILNACANSPTTASGIAKTAALPRTRLEIRYRLGHDWHRITFAETSETSGGVMGALYEDDHLLRKSPLSREALQPLLGQASDLNQHLTRAPASATEAISCFQPFEITHWNNGTLLKTSGCREKREVAQRLSRIIRESEFLIYSQKP